MLLAFLTQQREIHLSVKGKHLKHMLRTRGTHAKFYSKMSKILTLFRILYTISKSNWNHMFRQTLHLAG